MAKIIVRPTCIIVNDYDLGQCAKLEANFKLWSMTTHDYYTMGIDYNKDTRQLFLPRGVDIWYIQKCIGVYDDEIVYEDPDEFGYIDDIKMKYSPRDDVQKECLSFMLGLGKYNRNNSFSQLSVNLNTGKGKTFVSVYSMAYMKIRSIVITYSVNWLKQWKKCILEYTNLKDDDVYMISGASPISMILSGRSSHIKSKIFLITHSSLQSYGKTYGWDKVRKLFNILQIGAMYIDEAHLNFDNICRINFSVNVYKTFFITATPIKSDEQENNIYQMSMKNVPAIDLFDPENDPHTDYVAIKWNSKPTPPQISDCRNIYGLDRNAYISYVINKQNFEYFMFVIMDIVLKKGGRALFYIGTNEAIVQIYHWIAYWYPNLIGDIGIYTSIAEDKSLERTKRIILSTTKSAGAAEDFADLKVTVVLAEPFKSEVIARQTLGRTRNDNTLYIESVDLGFNKIKQYYYAKLPVFNKYASSTSDISLNQLQLEERASSVMEERYRAICRSPIKLNDHRFGYKDKALVFDNRNRNPLKFY